MIELKSIERSYKTGHTENWVLRRVNLHIRTGEFVTLMGPSGAGKSSLLNVLAMLDDGWKGEYLLDGEPVYALSAQGKGGSGAEEDRDGVPELPSAGRHDGGGEHIELPLTYKECRQGGHGRRWWRTRWTGSRLWAKKDLLPEPAFRGTAAAGGDRAGGDSPAAAAAGGRADGQPALGAGGGDHGAVS